MYLNSGKISLKISNKISLLYIFSKFFIRKILNNSLKILSLEIFLIPSKFNLIALIVVDSILLFCYLKNKAY